MREIGGPLSRTPALPAPHRPLSISRGMGVRRAQGETTLMVIAPTTTPLAPALPMTPGSPQALGRFAARRHSHARRKWRSSQTASANSRSRSATSDGSNEAAEPYGRSSCQLSSDVVLWGGLQLDRSEVSCPWNWRARVRWLLSISLPPLYPLSLSLSLTFSLYFSTSRTGAEPEHRYKWAKDRQSGALRGAWSPLGQPLGRVLSEAAASCARHIPCQRRVL